MYVFNVFGVFIWCRKHVGSRFPGISARSKGGQSQEVPIVLSEENERRRGMQVLEQKIQMCIVDSNKKIRSTSFEKDWNHCVHCAMTGGDSMGAAEVVILRSGFDLGPSGIDVGSTNESHLMSDSSESIH